MAFLLSHQIVGVDTGAPRRRLFLLHGIYGSGRNWKTFATNLASARPEYEIVLVDLRNHGASQNAPPPHTIAACAEDLSELARQLGGPPEVICAHSFGGKVAIVYAEKHGEALKKLILLDSPPGRGRPEEPTATEAG